MTLDEFENRVAQTVRQHYGQKDWFKGVCMDGVGNYYPDNLHAAIEHAKDTTYFWDGWSSDMMKALGH